MCYGNVGCYFVCYLCVIGKWDVHLIRSGAFILLENWLRFRLGLPPVCY